MLEEKLQGALHKIDALTRKNTGRTSTNFDSGKLAGVIRCRVTLKVENA